MFEGASAVQARVGFEHRQFQRCARARKSMKIPFLARSTIARLIILSFLSCLLLGLFVMSASSFGVFEKLISLFWRSRNRVD